MEDDKNKSKKRKEYKKPKLISEKLNAYGALCNGSTSGGRKASTGAPSFCNSRRLNS